MMNPRANISRAGRSLYGLQVPAIVNVRLKVELWRVQRMRALSSARCSHITNKDKYQSTSARRALALLNSPLVHMYVLMIAHISDLHIYF